MRCSLSYAPSPCPYVRTHLQYGQYATVGASCGNGFCELHPAPLHLAPYNSCMSHPWHAPVSRIASLQLACTRHTNTTGMPWQTWHHIAEKGILNTSQSWTRMRAQLGHTTNCSASRMHA